MSLRCTGNHKSEQEGESGVANTLILLSRSTAGLAPLQEPVRRCQLAFAGNYRNLPRTAGNADAITTLPCAPISVGTETERAVGTFIR